MRYTSFTHPSRRSAFRGYWLMLTSRARLRNRPAWARAAARLSRRT